MLIEREAVFAIIEREREVLHEGMEMARRNARLLPASAEKFRREAITFQAMEITLLLICAKIHELETSESG